jgi:hypothetical protein
MQDNILSPSSKKAINWVFNIMGNGWVVEKQTNYHSSAYPPWSSPTIPPLIHLPSDATSHEQALREKPHVKAYIEPSEHHKLFSRWPIFLSGANCSGLHNFVSG